MRQDGRSRTNDSSTLQSQAHTGIGSAPARNEGPPSVAPISLPKGGGAVRGIGEKFSTNPVTGTASMSVPLAMSAGRSGFGPQLELGYDSGAGNGPFGLGWGLSLPAINRKTDKGLPQYDDLVESDVFLLSGAEDLVPLAQAAAYRTLYGVQYEVQRYRPRIEGLFARVERWRSIADPVDTFWRSISRDNVTTWYGRSAASRIADPEDPRRIFSWLICESHDDKGNVMIFGYKPEDPSGAALTAAHEQRRSDGARRSNRYLRHVRYGNRSPYRPDLLAALPVPMPEDWCFELVFDYGEFDADAPLPESEVRPWTVRADAFSSYRAGFEVRTYRLCQRILMFHHFPEEPGVGANCLVRSTELSYTYGEAAAEAGTTGPALLASVVHTGWRRQHGATLRRSLPPLTFQYTLPRLNDALQEVDAESLENLPQGLRGERTHWVDLDGEGAPGVLTEQAGSWFFKRNLSPLTHPEPGASTRPHARFAPTEPVQQQASMATSTAGQRWQWLDLAGDGHVDLVTFDSPAPGFTERTAERGWTSFAPFKSLPLLDWNASRLLFIDLTGDGHADLLIGEDDAFCWHASLAEAGFGAARRVRKMFDEEHGPQQLWADGRQSIFLADMSGDGLIDLVRVRHGEVCYWPNLGYGRFGQKVTMDDAPCLEADGLFDPQRVRLADIDGSGTTDLIYLGRDGVHVCFNRSGNAWSAPQRLPEGPRADPLVAVAAVDLLGNGTACLVWSSPHSVEAGRHVRYIDLMGGRKPHLLIGVDNNMGLQRRINYAPSTHFYQQDAETGTPWRTRLPFPVHVVQQVTTRDAISGTRHVASYSYHHGHFDGHEREFRGFGRVDQTDSETFETFAAAAGAAVDAASHVPPTLTRTWYHTGAMTSDGRLGLFANEYHPARDPTDRVLADDRAWIEQVPSDGDEWREAVRALKGALLRQEVYALDDSEDASRPYQCIERTYTVQRLQARDGRRHAVFFTHAREQFDIWHERRRLAGADGRLQTDPRISHTVTLRVDRFGNVERAVAIGYRRRPSPDGVLPEQQRTHMVLTVSRFANRPDETDWYRIGLPVEARTFEVVAPIEPALGPLGIEPWSWRAVAALTAELFPIEASTPPDAATWPHEHWDWADVPAHRPAQARLRLVDHRRTLYRRDDLTGPLELGMVESLALPFDTLRLALTASLAKRVFVDSGKVPQAQLDALLVDEGCYTLAEGSDGWWRPSGRSFFAWDAVDAAQELSYARNNFFLAERFVDPFGGVSRMHYDGHRLFAIESQDPLGNGVQAVHDYRVLAPRIVVDPNGNRSEVLFDALGLVVASAVMGKTGEFLGDLLQDVEADPSLQALQAFSADPRAHAASLLGKATTRMVYDVDRFRRCGEPPLTGCIARTRHVSDGAPTVELQISLVYSDGFGRELQTKVEAEPGKAWQRQPPVVLQSGDVRAGPLQRDAAGQPVLADTASRWVGSGRTIYNNKGKPVRQYEPFFSSTALCESEQELTETGRGPTFFYDALQRHIATLHADHTWTCDLPDTWRQRSYDASDTTGIDPLDFTDVTALFRRLPAALHVPSWFDARKDGQLGLAEQRAALASRVHAGTPLITHSDSLGRGFMAVAHNRRVVAGVPVDEHLSTTSRLDIEGRVREVIDALGRLVMRVEFDLTGEAIHQSSMDAGQRWMLHNAAGQPMKAWDDRGFVRRHVYDELRRPIGLFVTEGGPERLAERTVYGEAQGTAGNHRTRVFQVSDQVGVVTHESYDFRGELLSQRRDLRRDIANPVDWQSEPAPNGGSFTSRTVTDALGRPVEVTAPDGSVFRPTYNRRNLLEQLSIRLRGSPAPTAFVTHITYDNVGLRAEVRHANGATSTYEHDPATRRLRRLTTRRAAMADALASSIFASSTLQDLTYTYGAVGNVTEISDAALSTVTHAGQQVRPVCEYAYDALHRLVKATGREHVGQCAFAPGGELRDHPFAGLGTGVNDLQALRRYSEEYRYDAVGNLLALQHDAVGNSWTRAFEYLIDSPLNPAAKSNRLSATRIGQMTEQYAYDAHGNSVAMPHLASLSWDFKDQLHRSVRQLVNAGTAETTHYAYATGGERVLRSTVRANGTLKQERISLGGLDIHRDYGANGETVTQERQTLAVMDDQHRIALVETTTVANSTAAAAPVPVLRFQLGNHIGSSTLELSADCRLISYEEYHPYGTSAYQAMDGAAELSLKRYRFCGKERDEETGLAYHGARYLAPWLGRWTSADPAGLADGVNLYAYVGANPVDGIDRDGLQGSNAHTGAAPPSQQPRILTLDDALQYLADRPADCRVTNTDLTKLSPAQLVVRGDRIVMTVAGQEIASAAMPAEDTIAPSEPGEWPANVPQEGGSSGYFAAGVGYGWAQQQAGVGGLNKMPWEITGAHHDPKDEAEFARGATWGLMLASTRDQAQAMAMAWDIGWLERSGGGSPTGSIQVGPVRVPSNGAATLWADGSMVQVHALEARAAAGMAAAGVLMKKYGGGAPASAPDPGDYRGRYNAGRISAGQKPLPPEYDAHHRIPQEYRNHPQFKNFDFDAPSNIRGVKGWRAVMAGKARANYHQEITNWWKMFRERFPNASRTQIENFAAEIDKGYARYYFR